MKCGFYEIDITPHLGGWVPGQFSMRSAETIHDTLYAKAVAIQGQGEPIVMIILDALAVDKREADRIQEGVAKNIGSSACNVSVGAIHSHTAGATVDLYGSPKDDEYCDFLVNRAVDAGVMAFKRMEEAKIGAAVRNVEDLAFNRRFRLKSGKVVMNPGILNPDIDCPVDVVDTQLVVIRVDHADGTPMGVIANLGLHTDTVGGSESVIGFSADYPGRIRKLLHKELGEDIGFVFLQGTSGNVNHLNVSKPLEEQNNYLSIGRILAKEILEMNEGIKTEAVDKVACTSKQITCRTRRPTREDCANVGNDRFRKQMLPMIDMPNEDIALEVWSAMVGEIVINMLPGEVFARFGLDIKEEGGCKYTMNSALSNSSIGYVYTKEAEKQGGYEATPSTYIIMDSDTGYKIVDAAVENMRALKEM